MEPHYKIKVLIADDHQMVLDGIKLLLQNAPGMEVIAEAADGRQVLDILQNLMPDIVLLDISMPRHNGLEATRIIKSCFPEVKVLILTMYNTRDYISSLLAAGADGYILKNTGRDELIRAINAVHKGENYYSKEVVDHVMEGLKKSETATEAKPELTAREKEIIRLVATELTSQEIANRLNISLKTVETHRANIMSKLDIRNSTGLIKYAYKNGLVTAD